MPRVKRGTVSPRQAQEAAEAREGVLPDQEQAVSGRAGSGRQGAQLRLLGPAPQEARFPPRVGRAHQRRRAAARAELRPAHQRPEGRRRRARSQEPGRARRQSPGRVRRRSPSRRRRAAGAAPQPRNGRARSAAGVRSAGDRRPLACCPVRHVSLVDRRPPSASSRPALAAARRVADVKAVRDEFLGRKQGRVTALLKAVGAAPPDERRVLGAQANALQAGDRSGARRARSGAGARPRRRPARWTSRCPAACRSSAAGIR